MKPSILVGLIGANIQKSLAPALFEEACNAAGMRGHYHLMDFDQLPGRSLESLMEAVQRAGFAGVNVTYPCKEAVVPLLHDVFPEARQIGAVNTVTIGSDGRTVGYNTDRIGFRRAFEDAFGRDAVSGKSALLVGAGGAGRAVAFALFDLGVELLLIHDTNAERAQQLDETLAASFGAGRSRTVPDALPALADAVGVVNATPVGMLGIPGIPVPLAGITARHWVADVIYTPLETELVKAASAKGCRVMGGAGMSVHQAVESFRFFTGHVLDLDRMRRTFVDAAAVREGSVE